MKKLAVFVAGSLLFGAMATAACVADTAEQKELGVIDDEAIASGSSADSSSSDSISSGHSSKGESSAYAVGQWKFKKDGSSIKIDTEFDFVNPTDLDLQLEYAFFETDGTFCGCDRDDFDHNSTVIYTMKGEAETPNTNGTNKTKFPKLFNCTSQSGAMKTFAFKVKNHKASIDDAQVVGFQIHAFKNPQESGDEDQFLTGDVMTEAGLKNIEITSNTFNDIRIVHQQCAQVVGHL